MRKQKIIVFAMLFIVFANFTAFSYDASLFHENTITENQVHICTKCGENAEFIEMVKMLTPRLQYLYFDGAEEIVYEKKCDIPENYFCVVIEKKNWVQEARRNVDEYNLSNIRSKSC